MISRHPNAFAKRTRSATWGGRNGSPHSKAFKRSWFSFVILKSGRPQLWFADGFRQRRSKRAFITRRLMSTVFRLWSGRSSHLDSCPFTSTITRNWGFWLKRREWVILDLSRNTCILEKTDRIFSDANLCPIHNKKDKIACFYCGVLLRSNLIHVELEPAPSTFIENIFMVGHVLWSAFLYFFR